MIIGNKKEHLVVENNFIAAQKTVVRWKLFQKSWRHSSDQHFDHKVQNPEPRNWICEAK